MAAFAGNLCKHFSGRNLNRVETFLHKQAVVVENVRSNHMFRYLQNESEHNDFKYKFTVSKNPEEWAFVEKLLPLKTVPEPTPKSNYPSGWRPPKDEALQLPYYVRRSKNHMLSVYLKVRNRGQNKITQVTRIEGKIWQLHDELKAHLEEKLGKKISSFVHEGNCKINFRGDQVYFIEQWLLTKGF